MELTLQHALGYLAAITVGISLGLIGSGGSIMAVPVLVYLMGVEPVLATAYSLFIVGFSALTGAIQFLRKKMIHLQTAILFAIPSLITVFITRKYIVPAIPDEVLTFS
ncbi:MAG: sulfite exporter TauE/SafE family protein, partial [Bacteroidetes bacterium]|nr:sulfite exporter TauE/SafE family protein [Bacteroidota bacterium]